jgi:hypothetical protein
MWQEMSCVEGFENDLDRGLRDVTPLKYRCAAFASCPAVLWEEAAGQYVIIGKQRDRNGPGVHGRVAPDETVLEIAADLLEGAVLSLNDRAASVIATRMHSLNPDAAALFLRCLRDLSPAATEPEQSERTPIRKETAQASAS